MSVLSISVGDTVVNHYVKCRELNTYEDYQYLEHQHNHLMIQPFHFQHLYKQLNINNLTVKHLQLALCPSDSASEPLMS